MRINFVRVRTGLAVAVFGVIGIMTAPNAAAAQTPDGSYQKSCRNISVSRDGMLRADCATLIGRYHHSELQLSNCRRGDISNSNGQLTCVARQDDQGRYDGRKRHGDNDNDSDNDSDHDHQPWSKNHGRGHAYGHDRNGNNRSGNNRSGNNRSGLVLYTDKRFRGRTMSIGEDYTNLGTTGFNDAVSSVRVIGGGTWRLCSDKEYGGRCVNVSADVADLGSIGLNN